jgi:tyramine---L-glutamate ligase
MRVFVYEYLSSGAAGDASTLPSLQTEGWAMLSAVLEDLARCPGTETSTLLDPRRKNTAGNWPSSTIVHFVEAGAEEPTFRALAADADFSLIIAPEFDGILEQRCRWVEEEGGRLLGPLPDAIRLTADKLTLAGHWRTHDIPTPRVLGSLSEPLSSLLSYPLVLKPRYGAGSQATFLLHHEDDLARAVFQAEVEDWSSPLLLQTYSHGVAVSVAFLANGEKRFAMPAVQQCLSGDGRFRYLGGRLPLPKDLDRRARHLAERAAASVEGLQGWFGIDLVLGDAENGSGDVAIEINPRLTTSYLGLRRLAHFNLAEALITIATDERLPARVWGIDCFLFQADGRFHPEAPL